MNGPRLRLLLLLAALTALPASAGEVIHGRVIDRDTHDPLPAYVSIPGTSIGRSADEDGRFSLPQPAESIGRTLIIRIYLIGYRIREVEAEPGAALLVELEPEPLDAHEVTVTADSGISETRGPGTAALDKMEVYRLPGTAADPLNAALVLPGINSRPDSSSLLIRGGGPEEVAYFFDGIEIDHPFLSESLHESYFSIFDNQVISGFTLSTSGFSPRFGDALSGVVDITAKDGTSRREGGLGLSILGLNSYAGIPVGTSGSLVGALNAGHSGLMTAINNRGESEFLTRHGFAKLRLRIHPAHTLRVLGLADFYDFHHDSGIAVDSRNHIAGLGLTSTPSRRLVSRLLISRIRYRGGFGMEKGPDKRFADGAWQLRWDAALDLESHYLEFGADWRRRRMDIELKSEASESGDYRASSSRSGLYVNDRFRVSNRVFMDLGARISRLRAGRGRTGFDPRAALAWDLDRRTTLRLAAGRYHQFGDPFDLAEQPGLRPRRADHLSMSLDRSTDGLDIRATAYAKRYRGLFVRFEDGSLAGSGNGFARGLELFAKVRRRRVDALVVYNHLVSRRRENTAASEPVRSPYEIPHSLTAILNIELGTLNLGVRWSGASGLPYTPLLEGAPPETAGEPEWGEPYSRRLPAYQRMDINGSLNVSLGGRLLVAYFGVTNLLGRKNVLRYTYDDGYSVRRNQYSIFGRSLFVGFYLPLF